MVSSSLSLLYFLLGFHGGRQGRGPDRERSPVEWGDFLSIRMSVHPLLGHPARPEAQPARPEPQPARSALPPPMKTKEKVEQGEGTADHLMPLGYLFSSSDSSARGTEEATESPRRASTSLLESSSK